MAKDKMTQQQRLNELLRLFGEDKITFEQFWAQMNQHGMSDADIDRYCREAK